MNLSNQYRYIIIAVIFIASCKIPAMLQTPPLQKQPDTFAGSADTTNSVTVPWRDFFSDPHLTQLIDTALKNNQELLITLQEIGIARNDIRVRQGKMLPFVLAGGGAGVEKVGRYTSQGAGDASTEITPGHSVPDWLPDLRLGAYANWEADIWKKLGNAKEAAVTRYLATVGGKNFVITNLIAEIANDYYELLSLDNQLSIIRQTIGIQKNALDVMKVQKDAARVTELAVKKFEAEVLNSEGREYGILQQITETENEINFLLGRYPQPIERDRTAFLDLLPKQVMTGIPSQLLANRPDIKQAELELKAAALDVKVARAEFYPSLEISSAIGLNAFKPSYLVKFPESMLFSLAGDLAGPLINKSAIKAEFSSATAMQLQALYNYDKTILNAYLEVTTQQSAIGNLEKAFVLKEKEVKTLSQSTDIAGDLFKSARADYFEVLMTQRDALDANLELNEIRLNQLKAVTNIYRALGGGWK